MSQDAAALLVDVQKQALRGFVWAILCYCPIQLVLWHYNPNAIRTPVSIAFEIILLGGILVQFVSLDRLNIRQNGILFLSWLGLIDVLVWITSGPQMSSGVALVCTILIAIFFVGRRAGAGVLLGFGVLILVHAALVDQGVLATYPTSGRVPLTTAGLLRLGLSSFGVLAVCYVCFAMIHRALFRTLDQVIDERRNRDLAEAAQRRAEETMRDNQHFEAMGKLTSGVAHDVNNALTSVLGNAELLKLSLPAGEQRAFADDIISAARSAAQTTRQLLSLNRQSICQPVSLDPATVATSVSRLVSRLMPENIRLTVVTQSQRRLLADPSDLQQALLNLLINARDAMPAGGAITLRTEDGPGAGVTVAVTDEGTGIPAEILPRIFDPFFTTKSAGQGTGLGLPMVKSFMEEAGGTVTARNNPGRGATFALSFPECTLPEEKTAETGEARPGLTGRHILLIEDQDDLLRLMERVLVRGGHKVTAVPSAELALARLETGDYDLLCTDGIFGATPVSVVIGLYRRRRPAAPVLLCSGHIDHELLGSAANSLHVDLLRKPFTGTELLARVQQSLQRDVK